jgi:cyclin-dependent kinase 2
MKNRYERIERIGEGAYGVVFKARDVVTNEIVAMKRIRLDAVDGEGIPATALREIGVLRELSCANVVRLDDVVLNQPENRLFLVFEYMHQDLRAFMDSVGEEGMSDALVRSFAYQILNGLGHCHSVSVPCIYAHTHTGAPPAPATHARAHTNLRTETHHASRPKTPKHSH